jgi:hypothetical protein
MSIPPADEASAILTRLLNALARPQGKRLSAASQADVQRLCELLMYGGEELDTALDDLDEPTPARVSSRVTDPGFERWRAARRFEEEERAG